MCSRHSTGAGKLLVFFLCFFFSVSSARAFEFAYKYKTGDKYRILSTVSENVYVNRSLSFKAEFVNRISVETGAVQSGKARLSALFQSAEKTTPLSTAPSGRAGLFQWSRDYQSEYEQDRLGYMTIDDHYYMPMTRNVPVFPGRDLSPGDTWSAPGTDVHDLRDSFGIEEPYRIPLTANYRYLGRRSRNGREYPVFSVSYRIFYEPAPVPGRVFPRRIQSASDQTVYWDEERGQPAAYEEYFRIIFDLSNNQTWEYRGRAEAEVVEAPTMDREGMAREIAEAIERIPDASVRVSDEGVVISLENIQFDADSAALRQSERQKLDRIAEILARYPDRDILVGGHTALAGTAGGRMELSLERAGAVADYLLGKKVRSPERVVIRGYGAERPVADNSTEEGMRKNRRVEITILEN
jgi:outer membrane protein OmpA-like peptidoglycan-associated protein